MRELKITYDVYTFEELPENIQDELIAKEQELVADDWDYFYSYDIIDDWEEKLESQGFNNPKINYRGFWSQGDSASFTTDSIDLVKLCDYLELWPVGKEKTYRTLLENHFLDRGITNLLPKQFYQVFLSRILPLIFQHNKLNHEGQI